MDNFLTTDPQVLVEMTDQRIACIRVAAGFFFLSQKREKISETTNWDWKTVNLQHKSTSPSFTFLKIEFRKPIEFTTTQTQSGL